MAQLYLTWVFVDVVLGMFLAPYLVLLPTAGVIRTCLRSGAAIRAVLVLVVYLAIATAARWLLWELHPAEDQTHTNAGWVVGAVFIAVVTSVELRASGIVELLTRRSKEANQAQSKGR